MLLNQYNRELNLVQRINTVLLASGQAEIKVCFQMNIMHASVTSPCGYKEGEGIIMIYLRREQEKFVWFIISSIIISHLTATTSIINSNSDSSSL